eukprot:14138457-Heterocapsa_arctica.AAC.1
MESMGTESSGPLIVIPGGSAQIADRLKEAEKAWGGLWQWRQMSYLSLKMNPWNLSRRMKLEE